ncbi:MAG TPA: GH3 auxin-responsive promoter family protein, partial [Micromonosporaceae bacterium]|nr:GH3 auxin-responsive promoter family protein [Micromonosporaceae bacterium]
IVALNPSKIVSLGEILRARADDLIADLRHGTLEGGPCHGGRDPELAARLEAARRFSPNGLSLIDLWPKLSLVVSWNSASAALYRPWLEEVTPGIPKLPFSATGTEGIITIPVDDHPSAGPLAVDLGLYEFVPVNDRSDETTLEPDVETLDYWEVEIGKTYNIVMSQANGLYRYDLGDRYTVVDRIGKVPRLDFVGRTGFSSSFTGEKLTEEDVYHAVRIALGEQWRTRPIFSCIPVWAKPPGYTLAIEWPEVGTLSTAEFAVRVENELRKLNVEYAEKRQAGRITPIAVLPVKPGTFGMVEEQRRQEGAPPSQLKHHWIQRNDSLLRHIRKVTG